VTAVSDMAASPQTVAELAAASGVAFGTSGVRGLVRDLTPALCHAYIPVCTQHSSKRTSTDPQDTPRSRPYPRKNAGPAPGKASCPTARTTLS